MTLTGASVLLGPVPLHLNSQKDIPNFVNPRFPFLIPKSLLVKHSQHDGLGLIHRPRVQEEVSALGFLQALACCRAVGFKRFGIWGLDGLSPLCCLCACACFL